MTLPVPFGNPATYKGHSGVDFAQPRGTQFRASGPGIVGLRSSNPRGGNMVWIDYDGYPGVAYAHLDDYRDSPPVGTRVTEGQVIGRVGNSGFSTGPHLHMEVYGHATTAGFWQFFDSSRVVGASGGASAPATPIPAAPVDQSEEDDMAAMKGASYKRKSDGAVVFILFNEVSGFCVEHSGVAGAYNNPLAQNWETNSWPTITESHAVVIKRALDAVRRTTVAGSLSVDITDAG